MNSLKNKSLLSISELSPEEIVYLIDLACELKEKKNKYIESLKNLKTLSVQIFPKL